MALPSAAAPLKRTDSLSPGSHQLPIASQLEMGLHESPFFSTNHARILIDLQRIVTATVQYLSSWMYQACHFQQILFQCRLLTLSDSYNLSASSSTMIWELGCGVRGRWCIIDVIFKFLRNPN